MKNLLNSQYYRNFATKTKQVIDMDNNSKKSSYWILGLVLFLGIALQHIPAKAAMQPNYYKQWMGLSSEVLLERGHQYSEITVKPDSALVCFSIVANRYNKQMSDKEKHQCCVAYIGKWYTFFFLYFDHGKSMEALTQAQEIDEETNGKEQARINLNFGCMYQTLAEQGEDNRQYDLALTHYSKAFQKALEDKQMGIANMAFSNILTISYELGKISTIEANYKKYVEANKGEKDERISYDILHYKGLLMLSQGKYQQAIEIFKKARNLLPNKYTYIRYKVVANDYLAKAYALSGQYQEAINTLYENLAIAKRIDMKDLKLEVYKYLSQYYGAMGNKDEESKWRIEYLSIKDTLLNYQQVASVNEAQFLAEMKKVDEQMAQEAQKRRTITISLFLALGIAAIIAIFLLIVYQKNKLLARRNRKLYSNNVEMLRKEEEERKRRQAMEQTIAQLKQEQNFNQEESRKEFSDTNDEKRNIKYKNSNLSDDQKQQLLNEIREAMENSEKIFDLNFTQDQLAEMVHSKSKYVSQVINELCDCNFSTFINEYRVKEACQRINDSEHFGNLTIEAISLSVGFKSRSTFNTAFRKFTGLTPGEYLKIAREKR